MMAYFVTFLGGMWLGTLISYMIVKTSTLVGMNIAKNTDTRPLKGTLLMNDLINRLENGNLTISGASGAIEDINKLLALHKEAAAELRQCRLAMYEASRMMGSDSCGWDNLNGWHTKHQEILDAAYEVHELPASDKGNTSKGTE